MMSKQIDSLWSSARPYYPAHINLTHVTHHNTSQPPTPSGVKYPLRWIQQIKAKSTDRAQWRVMVDAAAYVPTQPLDLRETNPDFVSMSFYKMFGYPTVSESVEGAFCGGGVFDASMWWVRMCWCLAAGGRLWSDPHLITVGQPLSSSCHCVLLPSPKPTTSLSPFPPLPFPRYSCSPCSCRTQGLGALIVRVDAAEILHKLFWGGGAVSLATSSADFHVLKCRPADKLEDGTVNFLDIISLKVGGVTV